MIRSRRVLPFLCAALAACGREHAASAGATLVGELAGAGPFDRTTRARVSVPLRYGRCTDARSDSALVPASSCASRARAPSSEVLRIASRASRLATSAGNADALHAAALVDLVWSGSSVIAVDRSISLLEASARIAPGSPAVWSDLAAAYLMRSELNRDVLDLLAALDAAVRAVEADSGLIVPRFTMAIVLTRLRLDDQAAQAWSAYLGVDSTTAWADEARAARDAIVHPPSQPVARPTLPDEARVYAKDPQAARLLGLDTLLPEWGVATLARDSLGAQRALATATWLASALSEQGADRSLFMMTAAIARAADTTAQRALAAAHGAYGRAAALYAAGDYEGCNTSLDLMDDARYDSDVLGHWARILRGLCVLHSSPPQSSIEHFGRIVRAVDADAYPALAARARWGGALSFSKAGRQAEALPLYLEAQELFRRAGEREHLGAVQHNEAFSRMRLAQTPLALAAIQRSIASLVDLRTSAWLHNVLYVFADIAQQQGFPRAAVAIASEAIAVADRRGDPRLMTESRIARARYASTAGYMALSRRDLDSATLFVARIPAGAARDWQYADLLSLLSAGGRRGSGAHRLASLDSVVGSFVRVGTPDRLVPALAARASAALEQGDTAGPSADLRTAVALIERTRRTVPPEMLTTMVDASRAALRRLAMLYVASGRTDDAMAAIERARFSPPRMSTRAGRLTSATPPRGTVVVSLALVGDTLLSWTLTSAGRHFSRSQVSHRALAEEVNRTAAQLEMGVEDANTRAGLTRLHDDLLRKALAPVSPNDSVLVLVTDGVIEAAPLGAAFDSVTGTYLIERYAVRYATSVADGLRPATRASQGPAQALVIADPAFAPREHPGLARLPEARAEASAVQAFYPRSVALGDTAASKARVVEAMATASVIHFAGHARFDPRNPDASELVLAASGDASKTTTHLRAGEISTWRWSHAPLVVLAACESALPRPSGVAGANSLTTAFLTAGARGVVGSLWRVDDALARPLMVEFHRAHRDGGNGAAALRSAQLALLRSSDTRLRSPSAWAAFRYTGN